jgi:hypothetical protein
MRSGWEPEPHPTWVRGFDAGCRVCWVTLQRGIAGARRAWRAWRKRRWIRGNYGGRIVQRWRTDGGDVQGYEREDDGVGEIRMLSSPCFPR